MKHVVTKLKTNIVCVGQRRQRMLVGACSWCGKGASHRRLQRVADSSEHRHCSRQLGQVGVDGANASISDNGDSRVAFVVASFRGFVHV